MRNAAELAIYLAAFLGLAAVYYALIWLGVLAAAKFKLLPKDWLPRGKVR